MVKKAIEKQPCSAGKTKHEWSKLGAKFFGGAVVYCQICLLESTKVPNEKTGIYQTKYYPHGT
jgi:hypothetical protein